MPDLTPVVPELLMAVLTMALLVYGVFRGDGAARQVSWLAIAILLITGIAVTTVATPQGATFGDQFILDPFAHYMKWLVLIGSGLAIVLSLGFNEREKISRFEYPILILFATLGMMMMVSANDLIALYIGLELQSLSLYVIAAFRRDSPRSSEAGLKYFILGALSSGMLLYGASLIYGFAGTTAFSGLAQTFVGGGSTGVVVGLTFVIAGLAFKVSAVPFHMWTPDVYEGAPTPVTAFFAVAPKIAALALFIRVLVGPFAGLFDAWQQIVVLISIASMVLGAFAAIWQTNIKRLMAYSSIGHVGYALIGLAAGTKDGVFGIAVYLAIYLVMNVGTFCVILSMRRAGRMMERIDDLAGISRPHPILALWMAVFMFSMAGIPPLAGFFGKLYVFLAAVDAKLYTLAVIGVLASVVSAFYYLRIVKVMYFDELSDPFERPFGREIVTVMGLAGAFTVLFVVYQTPILSGATAAAAGLFPG